MPKKKQNNALKKLAVSQILEKDKGFFTAVCKTGLWSVTLSTEEG